MHHLFTFAAFSVIGSLATILSLWVITNLIGISPPKNIHGIMLLLFVGQLVPHSLLYVAGKRAAEELQRDKEELKNTNKP